MPLRAPKGFIDETDPKVCQIGHPAPPWLVNYADLMTEMVCFFVILYALSAALDKKAKDAAADINKDQTPGLSAQVTKKGLEVNFEETHESALFESGSAELTPKMEELIRSVVPKLRKLVDNRELIVEGHTDNVPIHNDLYLNNWELSSARATNVVGYLVREQGLPPKRLAATGYGDNRPAASNDTDEGRKKNRRIVFLISSYTAVEPAKGAGEPKDAKAAEPGEKAAEEGAEAATLSDGGASGIVEEVLSRVKGK